MRSCNPPPPPRLGVTSRCDQLMIGHPATCHALKLTSPSSALPSKLCIESRAGVMPAPAAELAPSAAATPTTAAPMSNDPVPMVPIRLDSFFWYIWRVSAKAFSSDDRVLAAALTPSIASLSRIGSRSMTWHRQRKRTTINTCLAQADKAEKAGLLSTLRFGHGVRKIHPVIYRGNGV